MEVGNSLSYDLTGVFTDAEGDSLTITAAVAFPTAGALSTVWTTFSSPNFGGSPTSTQTATLTIAVSVSDGLDTSVFNFQITVNNPPSAIGTISATSAVTGHDYSLQIDDTLFSDDDGFSTLTITCTPPGFLSFSGTLTKTLSATGIAASVANSSPYSITITATDTYSKTATHTFSLAVTANSAPAGSISNQIAYVNEAFSFDFAGLITDGNSDSITYTATDNAGSAVGWLTTAPNAAATTVLAGTPAVSDYGAQSMKIAASDGIDSTDVTFTITVRDVPRLSNAIADQTSSDAAQDGHAYTFTFPANTFAHQDSAISGYTAVHSGGETLSGTWLTLASSSRTFSGTPAQTDVGDWYITLTATDSNSKTGSDTFKINVKLNTAPVYNGGLADQTVNSGSLLDYTFGASIFTDADGDTLKYTAALFQNDGTTAAISGAAWLTTVPSASTSRQISGTPNVDNSDCGSIVIQISATDSISGTPSATGTFHVRANCIPQIATITVATNAQVGHSYSYTIPSTLFTDQDSGDTLTYSDQSTGGLWGSISSSLVLTGFPAASDMPSTTFKVRVTDQLSAYSEKTFVVNIDANNAVTSTTVPAQTANEGVAYSKDFASYFSDADSDTLKYTITVTPSAAWLAPLETDSLTAVLSGTPADTDRGTYSVTISCKDDILVTTTPATQTFNLRANANPDYGGGLAAQTAFEGH